MTNYVIRRVGQAALTVVFVTVLMFVLLHMLPGGAAHAILGARATPLQIQIFNRTNHFDESLIVQYYHYIWQLLNGNLGFSYQLNQSVASLLGERIPKTLVLALFSLLAAILVGLPIGIIQALRRNRTFDYALTAVAFTLYGTPIFLLGLILVALFGVHWHLLPAQAPQTNSVPQLFERWQGLVLPVLTLAGVTLATFTRYTRSSVIEVFAQDYIRTARAKGASDRRVVSRHVVRNACLPVVTMLGLYLPALFGGALVVEYLFNYPGMGLLLWTAAQSRDYPVLLGVTLVISAVTVLGSLLVDIAYSILDPRIRLSSS